VVEITDKTAMAIESFTSVRDGMDRINNTSSANVMSQLFGAAMGNEMVAQVVGPEQAIGLLNQIFELAGVPRDFRLKMAKSVEELQAAQDAAAQGAGQPEQVEGAQQQLMAQFQQASQALQQQVGEQLAQSSEAIRQQVLTEVGGLTEQIAGQAQANANQLLRQAQVIEQLAQQVGGVPPPPEPPPPGALDTI
jgi:alanyl-tRNA synthetase